MKRHALFALSVLCIALLSAIPARATVLLYSQDFESGAMGPWISGGSGLTNTSGVPLIDGLGNFALYNNTGGSPQGTASSPITLTLTGLLANSPAMVQFTFIAIDSWDGVDFTCCIPDNLNLLANGSSAFVGSFRNHGSTNYPGDGTTNYGATTPANSTVSVVQNDSNLLFNSDEKDGIYLITVSGFSADSTGNLVLSWFADGAGWQGGNDESFALDNIQVNGTVAPSDPGAPEPGTWLLLGTGFLGVYFRGRSKARKSA